MSAPLLLLSKRGPRIEQAFRLLLRAVSGHDLGPVVARNRDCYRDRRGHGARTAQSGCFPGWRKARRWRSLGATTQSPDRCPWRECHVAKRSFVRASQSARRRSDAGQAPRREFGFWVRGHRDRSTSRAAHLSGRVRRAGRGLPRRALWSAPALEYGNGPGPVSEVEPH